MQTTINPLASIHIMQSHGTEVIYMMTSDIYDDVISTYRSAYPSRAQHTEVSTPPTIIHCFIVDPLICNIINYHILKYFDELHTLDGL